MPGQADNSLEMLEEGNLRLPRSKIRPAGPRIDPDGLKPEKSRSGEEPREPPLPVQPSTAWRSPFWVLSGKGDRLFWVSVKQGMFSRGSGEASPTADTATSPASPTSPTHRASLPATSSSGDPAPRSSSSSHTTPRSASTQMGPSSRPSSSSPKDGAPGAAQGGRESSNGTGGGRAEPAVRMRPKSSAQPPLTRGTSMIKKTPKDFIFGKCIGEGAFSCVYIAKEVDTHREFAIKVLEKQQMVREKKSEYVMREKNVLGMLGATKHPFFVSLYATFQDSARLYFVLSYEPNKDLQHYISKLSSFDQEATRFYAAEVTLALEHLHGLGIVHRDIKPENILLSKDMHIRITDFGSARILTDKKDSALDPAAGMMDMDRKSSFVGTAQYVSPEVLTNKKVCSSSDLWALGCIVYQLLSGQHPFGDGSEYMTFQNIIKGIFTIPEGFPETARNMVEKLLVADPDARLGCESLGGYTPLKGHPFFDGIDWETLPSREPPKLLPYLPATGAQSEDIWSNIPLDPSRAGFGDQHLSLALELGLTIGGGSGSKDETDASSVLSPVPGLPSSEEEKRLALKKQADDNEYHRFVEGNLIIKQGLLDKRKGLFARRRMFLLTEGPFLYYVDPAAMVLKGKVPWSRTLRPESKNFKIFFIHTPNRTYYLEDPQGYALQWVKKITEVWTRYYGPVNPRGTL